MYFKAKKIEQDITLAIEADRKGLRNEKFRNSFRAKHGWQLSRILLLDSFKNSPELSAKVDDQLIHKMDKGKHCW
jgi:hypothetical protein